MNIKVILNLQAGGGRGLKIWKKTEEVLRELKDEHFQWHCTVTRDPEQTRALAGDASQEGFDAIMVLGGDGTVGDAAAGTLGHPLPLIVIPAGTGNACARSLGLSANPRRLKHLLRNGRAADLDGGQIGASFFMNMAGIGFDSDVLHRYQKSSWARGLAGYIGVGLKALFEYTPAPVTLICDQQEHTYSTAMIGICNGRYYGGGLKMAPQADMQDGLLDICILEDLQKADYFAIWKGMYQGQHIHHPKVSMFQCRECRIESTEALKYHRDGDIAGETPCDVKILPKAVRMWLPERRDVREIQS